MANSDPLMFEAIRGGEVPPPFHLHRPKDAERPFLIAVPHSGRFYPSSLVDASPLDGTGLRLSEDAYVDHIFADLPETGATMIVATHARAYVDLNRAADELDPDMFHPVLDEATVRRTPRVKAGLGTIPAIVSRGAPIYDGPLPAREALHRVTSVHAPYHAKVRATLDQLRTRHGRAILVDCHSMPSAENVSGGRRFGWGPARSWPDIVLGDCWGEACDRELTALAEDIFLRAGFTVRRNVPYSGGYATQHYGAPRSGVHALQIELCRSLYMDEATLEPLPAMPEVAERLGNGLAELVRTYDTDLRLAAE
ncbi:N-formylglutamate amidohydrolase [Pseudokordiimonas caeni]|uniref:N-formylglutamate amidohydrolase n=1 Tax=Pseudokordiimonas caeni TaxID=2997908 RepID=UPI002811DA8E|nr:N-formylglutamate amidohydrolase [Pseudokordiimonas caeni]